MSYFILFLMDKRKRNVMRIFDDSDDSTEADPFQDRDGDFGSDKDFDPQGDTSGSESSRICYRQKSSKTSAQKPNTDTYDASDGDSETTKSDCTRRSINTPSPQSSTQLRTQELGTNYESSSSEEIFPLAKRLKLSKGPSITESHHEIVQEIPGCSAIPDINVLSFSQNLSHNMVLNPSNRQATSDETIQENLLPASSTVSQNGTLSTLSLISNVLAENYDHEGGFRSLEKLPPLFDASQNGTLDLSNLIPISYDVSENCQHGVVQEERSRSGELPSSPSTLENRAEGLSHPTETMSNDEDWVQTITSIPNFNFDADSVG